jgi:branched-chain amino acid transport system permease protein
VAVGLVAAGLALSGLPALGLPAFYESFLFLVFFWVSLATSWSYERLRFRFSFGHGAFFGAGVYTTATLPAGFAVPFLARCPPRPRCRRCWR